MLIGLMFDAENDNLNTKLPNKLGETGLSKYTFSVCGRLRSEREEVCVCVCLSVCVFVCVRVCECV